jgi:uncharacterized caspase-like protein
MENNWAIVIGINDYHHHPERELKYAVDDAQMMLDFLLNDAQFKPEQIILCIGNKDRQSIQDYSYPTYPNLLHLLSEKLKPETIGSKIDRFWFFFAGHGIHQNGQDLLITTDSLIQDIDRKIMLPVSEVVACLRKHQDTEIVLILDCCRNLAGSRSWDNESTEIGKETLEIARERGITTIFSCDSEERSYELDNIKHGSFTYALVEGLKQFTKANELEEYLKKRVPELNSADNKSPQQNPRIRIEPAHKASSLLLPNLASKKILQPINLDELGEIEKDIQTLSDIIIACNQVENPEGSLLTAVQENMKRGVRYTFLISKKSFLEDESQEDYLGVFKAIARATQRSNREPIEIEKLVRIKPLTIDWNYHPYVFYKTKKNQNSYEATTVYRGNEERRGICKKYFPLEREVAPVVYNLLELAVDWNEKVRGEIMSIEPKEFIGNESFKKQFLPDTSA